MVKGIRERELKKEIKIMKENSELERER